MTVTRPPKLLSGIMSSPSVVATYSDSTNPYNGKASSWSVHLYCAPANTGYRTSIGGSLRPYTVADINVGDWIAVSSELKGIANRITAITSVNNPINTINVIVDDPNCYNATLDTTGNGNGLISSGNVYVFEIGINGIPVLASEKTGLFDPIFGTEILSRFLGRTQISSGGGGDTLETPTIDNGSVTLGAITTWSIGTTKYTDAIVGLNDILGKLVPSPPAPLSSFSLSVSGAINARSGINILLSSGVSNFITGNTTAPGTQIYAVNSSNATTNNISGFSSGNSGSLSAILNSSIIGSIAISITGTIGTFGALTIVSDTDFPPSTPGFWKALTAHIATPVQPGINELQLVHSSSGSAAPAIFVSDVLTSGPVSTSLTVTAGTVGSYVYSSGIPHYTTGAILLASATVSNLAGQTYLANNNIEFSSLPSISNLVALNPGQILTNPATIFTLNVAAQSVSSIAVSLTGSNIATTALLAVRGRNSFTDGSLLTSITSINYMSGTPPNTMIETGMSMSGVTLKRVGMSTGNNPADIVSSFASATFNSSIVPASYEAVIRGGVLRCDQTNYSTGYLPVGPDYSSNPATQYISFVIQKIASNMTIVISGSDPTGLWIKLPGLSQSIPNATNGWWNGQQQYNFAPGQWPGSTGANAGAMSSKTTGTGTVTYAITFGSASSAGSTNNMIIIRLVLSAGQSISNIQVTL